jgi:tetratricopeptide (TPR) repeat protein
LWRALVYNQLALLSNQMGHWQYAKDQWDMANETWQDSHMEAGSSELQATLDWYTQLLGHYGFSERAAKVKRQHQQGQSPLLDPFEEQDKPPLLELTRLPGQAAAARPAAVNSTASWDDHLGEALKLAGEGKLPQALAAIDRAKEQAVASGGQENGQVLALIYNAESLACFQAGDYSGAGQAKQESARLWSLLGNHPRLFAGDTHPRFLRALEGGGQAQAALVFADRHRQSQCPLIDPWCDLEVGIQSGSWQNDAFDLNKDWKVRMETALQFHGRGNYVEAQTELGLLEQQLKPEDLQRPPGALLFQMQSVLAYAIGDYAAAQELYRKAVGVWERLEPAQRKEGPFLSQLINLVTMYGLEVMADGLGDRLCDPFVFYKHEHQMQKIETAGQDEEQADPREQWERQLLEAWEMASKGRWDMARRRASHSERVARLISNNDLRVAYSLDAQALFAHAVGDYTDADHLYEEAVRAWRRGSHLPAARTAFSEFCDILRQTQWLPLAEMLETKWDQPVSKSAFHPALLPLDSLARSGMKVLEEPAEEEVDDGALRLPTLPRKPKPTQKKMSWLLAVVLIFLIGGAAAAGWWWLNRPSTPPPTRPASSQGK